MDYLMDWRWKFDLVNEEDAPYDFISPMSDFGFKNFYTKGKDSKENLLVLLNAILHEQLGFEKIADLQLNPTEDKAENPERKTTFYDIHCTTVTGSKIIVEMQNRYEDNFKNRMFFYGVEAVMQQDLRNKKTKELWNYEIVPVVVIALCDFHLPGFSQRPMACFRLRDIYTNEEYGEQLQLVYIHMTEFTDEQTKCTTELEKIVYSMKNMAKIQRMEEVPFSTEEGDFYSRLAKQSRVSALSREDREYYDRCLKHEYDNFLREYKMMEEATRKGLEKGIAEGLEKGMAEGLEKGIAEGLEKGMAEGLEKGIEQGIEQEKINVARTAKSMGLDLAMIKKLSGLTEEQINALE